MDPAQIVDLASGLALSILVVAAFLAVARIATCQHLQDRIVALDLLLAVVAGAVAVYSARTGTTAFLDVLVVAVLVTFLGSILAARLLHRRKSG